MCRALYGTGSVVQEGGELIKKLEELEEAMLKGGQKQAEERLCDLQNKLNEGRCLGRD